MVATHDKTHKRSIGVELDASGGAITDQTIFTVPTGYRAIINLFFLSNTGGSTTTVDAKWHDGTVITFLGGKSLTAAEFLQFGGDVYLVMEESDYFTVSVASGGTVNVIISYELERDA